MRDAERIESEHSKKKAQQTKNCRAKRKVLVLGDSHARSLSPLVKGLSKDCVAQAKVIGKGTYPSLLSELVEPGETSDPEGVLQSAEERDRRYDQHVNKLRRGDVLVLASRLTCRLFDTCFSVQLHVKDNRFYDERGALVNVLQAQDDYFRKVERLARRLEPRGVHVVFVSPLPEIQNAPVLCEKRWFRPTVPASCEVSDAFLERREYLISRITSLRAASKATNLHEFDGFDVVCVEHKCRRIAESPELMKDATHLSALGLAELNAPFRNLLSRLDAANRESP